MGKYVETTAELPSKISMRKHLNSKGEVKHGDKSHFPSVWRKVIKFIEHNIGKKFETVYSKFCNNFVHKLDDHDRAIDCFLYHFRHTSYSDGKYVTTFENTYTVKYGVVYYIDENGKIAKQDNRRKRDKKIWVSSENRIVTYKKSDFEKNDWKKVLAEIKDQNNKIDREKLQRDELAKQYLLEWLEYNRKMKGTN